MPNHHLRAPVVMGKEGDAVTRADTKPTALRSQPDEYDPSPIYCFGNGVPRVDTVLPLDILDEIRRLARRCCGVGAGSAC